MNVRLIAAPGQWYLDRENGDTFQVVSVNEDDGSIDIQYVDGSLEEKSLEEWASIELESREQPEDWVGPFDDLESDEIGIPETTAEVHGAEPPMERALLEIEEQRAPDVNDAEG
jgi:hypothetical protein